MNTEYVTLDAALLSGKDLAGKKLESDTAVIKVNLEDLAFDIRRSPISPAALKEFIKALV